MDITLLATSTACLAGRYEAAQIAERTAVAFWLFDRDHDTALFIMKSVHANFIALADALGYDVTRRPVPAPDPAEAIAALEVAA